MGVSAEQGPKVFYGQRPTLGAGGSNNPDCGPGMVWGGWCLLDGRVGYNVTKQGAVGWYGEDAVCVDQVPSAHTTNAIAAAQTPTAGTPLTLVSTTGAGITVLATSAVVWASGNTIPAGSLAIDGLPGFVQLGNLAQLSTGVTRLNAYDPTKAIARAVVITSAGNDSGGTATVVGADLYGYTQTQTVTLANASTVTTTKTFKFIYSVTPNGTLSGSNISVGQADVFGLPMLASNWGAYVTVFWNNAAVSANTGFVAADTTNPATASTGDVRGTYAVQSASDGTKRLQIVITQAVANTTTNTGMWGVTPA